MKILYIVPYVPNGIRVRPYNLIRSLSERGNRVTVATLWSNEQDRESLEQLRACCDQVVAVHLPSLRSLWNLLQALPAGDPLQSAFSWDRSLAQETADLVSGSKGGSPFDVVHVEHLRGARYGLSLKAHMKSNGPAVPVVWDSVDSISLLFRQASTRSRSLLGRWMTRFELGRTEKYEGWLLGKFDQILVTSPADRSALLSLSGHTGAQAPIHVLRNGVDLGYFKPDEETVRDAASLVVSGKMSYHANVTMALHLVQDVMPLIWASRPEVTVMIVGKDPPKGIRKLSQDPRVIVTGTVSDIRPYLRKAAAAVAPVAYGVGIQNKVLEAMACETPVVASRQAVSALEIKPGEEVLVAEGAEDFAQSVLKLLNDPRLRLRVGRAGRRYVEENHDWRAVAARLEQIYAQAFNESRERLGLLWN